MSEITVAVGEALHRSETEWHEAHPSGGCVTRSDVVAAIAVAALEGKVEQAIADRDAAIVAHALAVEVGDAILTVARAAGWNMNEAVSMLREASGFVRSAGTNAELADEIDDALPKMQQALELLAATVAPPAPVPS